MVARVEVVGVAGPITDEERDRVRTLHAEGKGRNEIAQALGRSAGAVTKIAHALGLSFDRSATKAATEARMADAKANRAELALELLDDARRLRAQLWQPCIDFNFGGRDNTYNEVSLDRPTFANQLKIMQAVGAAVDRCLRLDLHDADNQGLAAVDAWLRSMTGGD